MNPLQRRIYSLLLRLHPENFRDQFGREMARDCEDAVRERGFAALLADAAVSFARQWKERMLAGPEVAQPVEGHPFLAGQYVMVDRGWSVTAFDLARASVLSIVLLLVLGFAAGVPNRRVIADVQSARVGHDGGVDSASTAPAGAASSAGHREAAGAPAYLDETSHGGAQFHGRVRLGRGPGLIGRGFRSKLRGGSPVGTLEEVALQWAIISGIIWLISLFFRRASGIGRKVVLATLGLLGIAASVAFASIPAPATHAQILHAIAPLPSFEVASVKPVQPRPMPPPPIPGVPDNRPPGPRRFGIGKPGGQPTDRVHLNSSAALLVLFAYNLPFGSERTRIVGGPDWLLSAQYEIQAKIDDSMFAAMQKMTPAQQREQVDLMEQSLLADRFKLKAHFETREMPVYALVVGKGGSKLSPAKEGEVTSMSSFYSEMTAQATTLDDFAHSSLWTPINGRLVVDQTGLTGAYDFSLNWSQDQAAAAEPGQDNAPALSPIFTALEQQLGLKLVPSKAPIEVIVIDHIEKPSEN